MFSRLWKALFLALCSTAGIACSHQYGSTNSETASNVTPVSGTTVTSVTPTCGTCAAKPAVQPCAECAGKHLSKPCSTCGKQLAASTCSTCSGKPVRDSIPVVAVKPCAFGRGRCYTMMGASDCKSCQTAKTVVAAPGGCSSCQAAKTAPNPVAINPYNPVPPKRLDMVITAPQNGDETHVVNKPDYMTAPKEFRDPQTGAIRFDHARDYAWVVGQLEYLHSKHQWRVRYSPCDVDDEHGGVVMLSGIEHLSDRFQDGMVVRIQGQLVNAESRKSSPEYYVYDLKVIQ